MTLTQNGESFEGKLERFEQNGLELIIDTETGEVFASQGMIAKLCKQESSTIRYFINKRGVNELPQTLSVIDSRGVEQLSKLHSEDAIYAAIEKYNPTLLKQCAKAGLRMYLHGLAGFRYRPIAVDDTQKKEERDHTLPSPALIAARECREIMDLLELDNPRLAQVLIDASVNHHIGQRLLSSKTDGHYYGVVEIAESMGHKLDSSSRVKLGKVIASMNKFNGKKEKRLCNGTMKFINCYQDTPEIRQAIDKYFS